jgi:hypothetical protein
LSQKIRLKYEELASIQLCHYVGLAELARQIFGGSQSAPKSGSAAKDYNLLPSTGDIHQDLAAIRGLLRGG